MWYKNKGKWKIVQRKFAQAKETTYLCFEFEIYEM